MSDYVKLLLIISLHSQNQTIICLQNNKKFIIPSFVNSVSLSETYKITAFSAFDPFTKTICIRKMHLIYSCSTWACSMYNVTDIRRKESMWYQNFNESINNIIEVYMLIYKVSTYSILLEINFDHIAHLQNHLMRSLARDKWSDL